MKLQTGWGHVHKLGLEPKQNWEEIFERNADKNILDSKIAQINTILSPTEKKEICRD